MSKPTHVVVHPLVLLSVVDHYNRVGCSNNKRVVGMLLGEVDKDGKVDVTNSYALPFDEDNRNEIWFLDHNYHERMYAMFKKVNIKEVVVGWYSTGPKIRPTDTAIHEVVRRYAPNGEPAFVVVDAKPKELGIPTKAYITVEEVSEDGSETKKTFKHIGSSIDALEAEEVGVEHLLRDVKDASVSTLTTNINDKISALESLTSHIKEIEEYLTKVVSGEYSMNHQIIFQLQDIFNLMPNLNIDNLVKAFAVKTNDMYLVLYLSSLIRSVIALHNLINNQITNKQAEAKAFESEKEKETEKEDVENLKSKLEENKKKEINNNNNNNNNNNEK
eukprot:TRINITY_DN2635_c3_g1_i1.p1 TRINITY_DN2635_c3_g1~~TRINITY_DN2635_c3_g1_i1.p1  ORF type:complete len:331 (+),score=139.78 TRINITY_DN2635_c3_g1_i1:41-1033(+)